MKSETLRAFYDELGDERKARLKAVSLDMGIPYAQATTEAVPHVTQCVDPFHVVAVRHEAPRVWVGCKDPPPACRSRPVKLEAA